VVSDLYFFILNCVSVGFYFYILCCFLLDISLLLYLVNSILNGVFTLLFIAIRYYKVKSEPTRKCLALLV